MGAALHRLRSESESGGEAQPSTSLAHNGPRTHLKGTFVSRRDQRNGTRGSRRTPRRVAIWAPTVLVVGLLGSAAAADHWAWGPKYLGWEQDREPALVAAPEILGLGDVPAVTPVADEAPTGLLDEAAIRKATAAALGDDSLGRHVVAAVASLDGTVVFSSGNDRFIPASTAKVLTGVAALDVLGPDHRFTTSVETGASLGEIVLVGGGDPYLRSEPAALGAFPEQADLVTLAVETAAALTEAGTTTVQLTYDTSLFSGPDDSPDWEESYVGGDVVSPIGALWVDRGVDEETGLRVEDPAAVAAQTFADALTARGITVGEPQPGQVTADGVVLADVDSAPVSQIVERVLEVSDNEGAEVLARHVGLAVDDEGSFTAGAASVLSTLETLGVDVTGAVLHDGSGLSRGNVVRATTLVQTLAQAAADDDPRLRAALDGLPVAGFTGSLSGRFDVASDDGLGKVRAKTGTLTGVHALAGITTDASGVPMLFVIGADKVPVEKTLQARATLDQFAAALSGCVCSTPSA